MAVRIRLKRMGRTHRPLYRVCAMDKRAPRNGRVIEELGYYDPMVKETDARAILRQERIDYWLGVGAEPSDKVKVLISRLRVPERVICLIKSHEAISRSILVCSRYNTIFIKVIKYVTIDVSDFDITRLWIHRLVILV